MNNSRARAIKLNMLTGWAQELLTLISGLILPRLVLTAFGSDANGLVNSIAQYLGFSTVLRAGLGGVTRAALYKPLADKDLEQVSSIMVATQSYMRKVAVIVAGYVLTVALVYPFLAKGEFSRSYMFVMVLVIGSNSVAENFFSIKAKILLQADQKYYVQTLCTLASQIIAFLLSVVLIKIGSSLLIVKLFVAGSSLVSCLLLNLYVRKHYNLNRKARPNNLAIKQRWDAFAQQMAVIINDNVDLFLMTLFVNLKEISVYTVHNMVTFNIKKIVEACVTGIDSTFGDMMAKNEKEHLRRSFQFVEWAFFAISVLIFSVTAIMLTPFIRLYTANVNDVNYVRPLFAIAITLVAMMGCMRRPYQLIVEAAGHFKQTRNGAVLEAIINVVVSLVMLYFFGIIGVIIGTFFACVIRTLQYGFYSYKHFLNISRWRLLRTYGIYMLAFTVIVVTPFLVGIPEMPSWWLWCVYAVVAVIWAALVVLVVTLLNNYEQFVVAVGKFKKRAGRKKHND